jgi:hypothetical protein
VRHLSAMHKDVREFIRRLEAEGLTVEPTTCARPTERTTAACCGSHCEALGRPLCNGNPTGVYAARQSPCPAGASALRVPILLLNDASLCCSNVKHSRTVDLPL